MRARGLARKFGDFFLLLLLLLLLLLHPLLHQFTHTHTPSSNTESPVLHKKGRGKQLLKYRVSQIFLVGMRGLFLHSFISCPSKNCALGHPVVAAQLVQDKFVKDNCFLAHKLPSPFACFQGGGEGEGREAGRGEGVKKYSVVCLPVPLKHFFVSLLHMMKKFYFC